jgi:hypothetical protein
MTNVFGKKVDLRASRLSIRSATSHFAFARHRTVILGHRHRLEHFHVEIVGEYAVESQMIKRGVICVSVFDRIHNKIGQMVD